MFAQIVINGLVLAGGYALVAVGLTLTFGVMRMVNFAEGQSVMIGAFVAYTAVPPRWRSMRCLASSWNVRRFVRFAASNSMA
jgi:branched-subunit amino acid ABC-type transport system permease component